LRREAIRLVFRQEQNHEPNDTNHQPVAPTLSRRHADAQLSPKTQSGYLRTISRFYGWLGRSPDTATAEDLRRYQLHLVDHGISPISLNTTITGLKFFFESTLDRHELMRHVHPVHVPRKIPIVLSPDEVVRLIGAAGNLKNRTALSVAYGAGLRVSEVAALNRSFGTGVRIFLDCAPAASYQCTFQRASFMRIISLFYSQSDKH